MSAPTAWDCADDKTREITYNGMARDLVEQRREIGRLRTAIYMAGSMHAGGASVEEIMKMLHDTVEIG